MTDDIRHWLFQTSALRKSYRDEEATGALVADEPGTILRSRVDFGAIELPRGGIIALIGASGTGKTTLFNLLGGLDQPDPAENGDQPRILLNLDGAEPVDICAHPERFPRARVGFIFQSGFLLKNAAAGLNLALPAIQQGRRPDRDGLAARLSTLDIPEQELDERAWKFSGGEAQRIAFVRSVAHDPDLIFADEPTSNVDYRKSVKIMGQLRDWVHNPQHPGRTLLWITHDVRLAAAIADAALVLHTKPRPINRPLRLPGEPGRDHEQRVETLERWTYNPAALQGDDPEPWTGISPPCGGVHIHPDTAAAPAVDPLPPMSREVRGRFARARVRLGAMLKIALSEVFSRHRAQKRDAVRRHVNPALSLGGGAGLRGLPAWLRAFGQGRAVLELALIMCLATAGLVILDLVDNHYERSISDPRNCHVVIKELRDRSLENIDYGDLRVLAGRPWRSDLTSQDAQLGAIPRATCVAGDAAYGRRDARGWGIAPAYQGECPSRASTYVRLLTADEYEPVWTETRLLALLDAAADAPAAADAAPTLAAQFDAKQVVDVDLVYITDYLERDLGAEDLGELVGDTLCLYDSTWPTPVQLKIGGIIDNIPSWERTQFSGYIPNYTYDAFRDASATTGTLVEGYTHIALYFDGSHIDELEDYLTAQGYGFVKENLDKIRRLIATSETFKVIILGFLGVVAALLVLLTYTSVDNYLRSNEKSFALLRAFGMNLGFMAGVLIIEIAIGWTIAALLIATAIAAMDLYSHGVWWQLEDIELTGAAIWHLFVPTATTVLSLSVLVAVVMSGLWWRRNRFVAPVLKAG